MNLCFTRIASPVGTLKLVATETSLVAVVWRDEGAAGVRVHDAREAHSHPVLNATRDQLEAYFAGERRASQTTRGERLDPPRECLFEAGLPAR